MAAYFIDSSALVKRFAVEVGTPWVINLFRPALANRIYVARITSVEVVSALTRRLRAGSLTPGDYVKALARFRRALSGRVNITEITASLIQRAEKLAEKHALRGYDAVQLAAALTVNDVRTAAGAIPVTLISADDPLNAAAAIEGLLVENPNLHP
jgi:predicted nucleic acid-binding protein